MGNRGLVLNTAGKFNLSPHFGERGDGGAELTMHPGFSYSGVFVNTVSAHLHFVRVQCQKQVLSTKKEGELTSSGFSFLTSMLRRSFCESDDVICFSLPANLFFFFFFSPSPDPPLRTTLSEPRSHCFHGRCVNLIWLHFWSDQWQWLMNMNRN